MMSGRGRSTALSLYRGIRRAHRRMPMEMRALGDSYVRSEFKLHKSVTNEAQLEAFFTAWEQYLDQLMQTARRKESVSAGALDPKEDVWDDGFGQSLPPDTELSDEQRAQIDKLKEEATKGGRSF